MKQSKKQGVLALSTILSLGIVVSTVSATTPITQPQEVQFLVASTDSVLTKSVLIKRVKELFPSKFNFLNDNDFYMNTGYHDPNDDTIRYELSFHKEMNGYQVFGDFGFVGEDLNLERFYYEPIRTADALFPPKITVEKAEEIARTFLSEYSKEENYQLDHNDFDYLGNQSLTEPIHYSFSFVRTNNNVPISDQQIQVTVLGNGEVVEFYSPSNNSGSQTYDDVSKAQEKDTILRMLKENLSIDLQYRLNVDYLTRNREVELIYQPTGPIIGVHAISGDWQTTNGFSAKLPEDKTIKLITAEPLQPKEKDFSIEEAKSFAEKLLKVDSKKMTFVIESVEERNNENGQEVISIQYIYSYQNDRHESVLLLDKQTGEILQYNDLKSEVLELIGEEAKSGNQISREKALEQAVKYLKEYTPSYLHNYAMPMEESYFEDDHGIYYFCFPRVVNDIPVSGDQIFVTISSNGSLLGLNVNNQVIENWPSSKEIISKEEATAKFLKELSLTLRYVKEGNGKDENHYDLVYSPVFKENSFSYIDAHTGEWKAIGKEERDRQIISHHWAEDELNSLINAGILEIEDGNTFDVDASVTKGQAIEVIMKSLIPFYDGYDPYQENMIQSYKNIGLDHPLYQVIERAVAMDILDTENSNFDVDAHLTREELAVWYVRSLGSELAAEHSSIDKLDFADVDKIKPEYIGYVALANALGILTGSENHFNPDQEVTYAELAISIFRLAREVNESGQQIGY